MAPWFRELSVRLQGPAPTRNSPEILRRLRNADVPSRQFAKLARSASPAMACEHARLTVFVEREDIERLNLETGDFHTG